MRRILKDLGRELNALVFPDKCLKCGVYIPNADDGHLSRSFCTACTGPALPVYQPPFCTCCGVSFDTGETHLCESCLKDRPDIGMVRAAFTYQGLIREAVGLFKYNARLSLAKPFEAYLFEALVAYFSDLPIDRILPIPLHPAKARKRGFNQSFLLVRGFPVIYRKRYGQPPPWQVDIKSLVRVKETPTQTGLDTQERERNLRDAFQWRGGREIEGKSLLLIDDVFTTGATCRAAAKTLLDAGAERVDALVLARA
ncbi:MAG: ComF family protein [Desulfobacterales bacterium]|nr:ComF family protein [Desulfobacterales bacterium]